MGHSEKFVTVKQFAENTGLSATAVYGYLLRGMPHERKPSPKGQGPIRIPQKRALAWLKQKKKESRSDLGAARRKKVGVQPSFTKEELKVLAKALKKIEKMFAGAR